jgi:caa(3)-type oxidase subunit IV
VDTKTIDYKKDRATYYKVLVGLLLLTAVTFVQPHLFMTHSTFLAQMIIAVIKAWLIVMYFMHLKGEKLIGWSVVFAMFLVTVFFVIVIGVDVPNFQFAADSYITSAPNAN